MRSRSSTNIVLILGFVWCSAGLTGCVRPPPSTTQAARSLPGFHAGRQSECVPEFPDRDGWYGADAAYSVPLPTNDGRTSLWLFGDTFVERPGSPKGRAYPFVHNSIGISDCRPGGEWRLETHWQRNPEAQPRAFFVPEAKAAWVRDTQHAPNAPPYYWPFDGFIAHDALFVGLLRVVESAPRGPFSLPFRLAGMDLARIENFRDAPADWQIRISTLSNNISAFPGSAFVESESYLYAFAFFDRGDGRSPRMLSRLPLDSLVEWQPDLSENFETWTKDASWTGGFVPEDAMILMDDDTSEMSVYFDAERETWVAVYVDPALDRRADGPGFLRIRHSEQLTGLWSEPRPLLAIPETTTEPVDENLFCYAGKAHAQFASRDEILVTYVCNLFAPDSSDNTNNSAPDDSPETLNILERLRTSPQIYRPRAIRVERPRIEE